MNSAAKFGPLTMPFSELRSSPTFVEHVGGKCASLGELMHAGQNVPDGFAVTTGAYRFFLDQADLRPKIAQLLQDLNVHDTVQLAQRASAIRELILDALLPEEIVLEITRMYQALGSGYVSVRSSTSIEDGADASFAGQQDTFLNMHSVSEVISAVQKCFSSLWTDRALLYSTNKGFNHLDVSMAVGVQNMALAHTAGVMFTIDPNSGHHNVIDIEGLYGLGETIVGGGATPDAWLVSKFGLVNGGNAIIERRLGSKELRTVRTTLGTITEPVPHELRQTFCLTDVQILRLAKCGMKIQEHYRMPMDIEWVYDEDGVLWILQARPETVASKATQLQKYSFKQKPAGEVLASGTSVGNMVATGRIYVMQHPDPREMAAFPEGGILVTEETTPSWLPVIHKAAAIITMRGGRTSHAAIVAREQAKPAIVGVGDDFFHLRDGTIVTVSCAEGDEGRVYEGEWPYEITVIDPKTLPKTRTKMMFNLADPNFALARSQVPNDGVGLLRAELIMADLVRAHPNALLNYPNLDSREAVEEIARMIVGHSSPREFFIDTSKMGVAKIAAAFAPNKVIYRLSDFRSNEYRDLIGGRQFELPEENPMIGLRGPDRYTHPRFAESFALECEALRRVRNEMGFSNLRIMIPFIRTLEKAEETLELMARYGIGQGVDGLEVYAMIEVPSNVFMASEMASMFDGFSFGSNDLTQLVLGIDRDNEDPHLRKTFDEMNPAVLRAMEIVLAAAQKANIPCGICGQGPSDRPEFAQWLVQRGITSLSVVPDAIVQTLHSVAEIENQRVFA